MLIQAAKIFNKGVSATFYKNVGLDLLVGAETVRILSVDRAGYISESQGSTKPTDGTAGYSIGSKFTDSDSGAVYYNTGTVASCTFTLNGTVTAGSVDTAELADGAVTTDKIDDAAVTAPKVADAAGASGLFVKKTALMLYDFDVDGGTIGNIVPAGAPTIPDNAIVWLESYDVLTTVTTAGADAGTIKLDFATDGSISSALAVSDALNAWDAGAHLALATPLQAGLLPVAKKLTAARTPRVVVATQNLTAGKIVFQLAYWVSA